MEPIEEAGSYIFQYDIPHTLRVKVSRVNVHSNGRVVGEITIDTGDGHLPVLPPKSMNFLSDRAMKDIVKTLTAKKPDWNWQDIIDYVSLWVIEKTRFGEPVITLNTEGEIRPPQYILKPFIIRNYPTVFFGERGAAKSTVAVVMGQMVILPWVDNPLHWETPSSPVKCLYLDWETDPETIKWQLAMLQRGMRLPMLEMDYRHCALPLWQDMESIRNHIVEKEADVVIIDSLGLASGSNLKETDPALNFFTALRQLKTTSLILAQTSKNIEEKKKSIYGNALYEYLSRSIWEIRKVQEPGDNEMDVALFHRKPPPFQKTHAPLGMKVVYNDLQGTMEIRPQEVRSVREFVESMGTQTRILELLREGSFNPGEIMNELDISRSSVDVALHKLKGKNKITKLPSGKWGLLADEWLS